jgi:hypothetical protein
MPLRLPNKAVACASFVALALSCGAGNASDHRESAAISTDPAADITDFYAFTNPNGSARVVLAMAVNPASIASIANTYLFSSKTRYVFHIDNDGDYRDDATITLRFSKEEFPVFSATGELRSGQTFSADFRLGPKSFSVAGTVTPQSQVFTKPFAPVIVRGAYGVEVFAGPRNDPFFFDGVDNGRVLEHEIPKFVDGIDRNAGAIVDAIVVELPTALIYKHRPLHLWASTEKQGPEGGWRQVQRAGNPAVKAVYVPPDLMDAWNVSQPADDRRKFGAMLAKRVPATFPWITRRDLAAYLSIVVPDTLKLDPTKPVKLGTNGRGLDDPIDWEFWYNLYSPVAFAPGNLNGVLHNDVANLTTFPYIAPPLTLPFGY